jgi:2-oxoglutarate dehydrogenase E2 component (dihydrolipoamide succinyltransferase)
MDKFLNSIVYINFRQFVAKEGDTVEPGTKIAVISKSGEGVAHVGPSEKTLDKAVPQPSSPIEETNNKPKSKVETTPVMEKPKAPSPPPPKHSAQEPQLPPKERERRVRFLRFLFILLYFLKKTSCISLL